MTEAYVLTVGHYGLRASIMGRWSKGLSELMVQRQVRELELNYAKGWIGEDVAFLENLPDLLSLSLVDRQIKSVSEIHCLRQLRALTLVTYSKTPVDFSAFPELEECVFEWLPGSRSLFECQKLRDLFINLYKGHDLASIGRLRHLTTLAFMGSPIEELDGIGNLTPLVSLRLGNLRKLKSLAGLEGLVNLEHLTIQSCKKIDSISPVAGLGKLRSFQFRNSGVISSIEPLRGLINLECILLYETCIKDGDLGPIINLPNLRDVAFKDRHFYSHTQSDFAHLMDSHLEHGARKAGV